MPIRQRKWPRRNGNTDGRSDRSGANAGHADRSGATAFHITCPRCGQRLRFATGEQVPGRIRIQCSSCHNTFAVRRPGADPNSLPSLADSPTFTALPLGADSAVTSPLPHRVSVAGDARRPARRLRRRRRSSPAATGSSASSPAAAWARSTRSRTCELRERVALKTVRADIADDEIALERFRREIQLARQVTHPNVCRIFDVSHHRPDGGARRHHLPDHGAAAGRDPRRAPAPRRPAGARRRRCRSCRQIAARARRRPPGRRRPPRPQARQRHAGARAPRRARVRAVVTDFGLARGAGGREDRGLDPDRRRRRGRHAGLHGPRADRGRARSRAAVDIYALGIVLYEMLTGKRAVPGDTAARRPRSSGSRRPPPSPRLHVPDLDPRWEAVILRCLAARSGRPLRQRAGDRGRPPRPGRPSRRSAAAPAAQPAAAAPRGPDARRRLAAVLLSVLSSPPSGRLRLRVRRWREPQQAAGGSASPRSPGPAPVDRGAGLQDSSPARRTRPGSRPPSPRCSRPSSAAGGDLRIVPGENVARMQGRARARRRPTPWPPTRSAGCAPCSAPTTWCSAPTSPSPARRRAARSASTCACRTPPRRDRRDGRRDRQRGRALRAGRRGWAPAARASSARASPPGRPAAARRAAGRPRGRAALCRGARPAAPLRPAGARDLLARAAARDPDNALVHAALAAAWAALGYDGRARDEAQRRLRASPRPAAARSGC